MANELPSLAELQGTYGAWNPQAYTQAKENQSLAGMFQQEGLSQQRLKTQTDQQSYNQNELMNPLRVQQLQGTNTQTDIGNQSSALDLDRKAALHVQNLDLDQKKQLLAMGDADIAAIDQHAEQLARSQDPAERAQGEEIRAFSKAAADAKRAHAYQLALEQERTRSHLKGIGMQTASNEKINTDNNNAGRYAKKDHVNNGISGIQAAVQAGKMTAEKAAVAFHGAAMFEPDPDLKQRYEALAQQYEQFDMNRPRAGQAGKLDVGAMTGQPTTSVPSALAAPQSAPKSAQAGHTLSDLRTAYPGKSEAELKAAYKRKFGVDPR